MNKQIHYLKRKLLGGSYREKVKRYKFYQVSTKVSAFCLFSMIVIFNLYFLWVGIFQIPELTYVSGGEKDIIGTKFWLYGLLSYVIILFVMWGLLYFSVEKKARQELFHFLFGGLFPLIMLGQCSLWMTNYHMTNVVMWLELGVLLLECLFKIFSRVTKKSLDKSFYNM
ncbi:hypothetical protein [Listeria seeligeri]|uniref:hypothetical protein n=1 Tax=Listeria seeligeri TaxID=1640 RepID=UPI00311B24F7